jgi:hypothetical protein
MKFFYGGFLLLALCALRTETAAVVSVVLSSL